MPDTMPRPTVNPEPTSPTTGKLIIDPPTDGTKPAKYKVTCTDQATREIKNFEMPADADGVAENDNIDGLTPGATYSVTATGYDANGKIITFPAFKKLCTTPSADMPKPEVFPQPLSTTTGELRIEHPPTGPPPAKYKVTCVEQGTSNVKEFEMTADGNGDAINSGITGLTPGATYEVTAIGFSKSGKAITLPADKKT